MKTSGGIVRRCTVCIDSTYRTGGFTCRKHATEVDDTRRQDFFAYGNENTLSLAATNARWAMLNNNRKSIALFFFGRDVTFSPISPMSIFVNGFLSKIRRYKLLIEEDYYETRDGHPVGGNITVRVARSS